MTVEAEAGGMTYKLKNAKNFREPPEGKKEEARKDF